MPSSSTVSDIRSTTSSCGDDAEILVRVEGVSKKFCRDLKKSLWYGVKDVATELLPFYSDQELLTKKEETPSLRDGEFWANKEISFELRRGECLGLIGHNGAGKTTLLKMLNGLIKPDTGRIEMRGRVGALIALGAGFNPILTGRENIYVNGAVLGLSKPMVDEKIDEIIAFAEIGEFIDAPVQSYSSGMQVRLGFAVATAMEPDVLILDEVLAVGDISFRSKCYNRIGELKNNAAVIFVSHNINHVSSMCSSCILLEKGKSNGILPLETAIREYLSMADSQSLSTKKYFRKCDTPVVSGEVILARDRIEYAGEFSLRIRIQLSSSVKNAQIRIILYTKDDTPIMDWWSIRNEMNLNFRKGLNDINIHTSPVLLKSDTYFLSVVIFDSSGARTVFWSYHEHSIRVTGSDVGSVLQLKPGIINVSYT